MALVPSTTGNDASSVHTDEVIHSHNSRRIKEENPVPVSIVGSYDQFELQQINAPLYFPFLLWLQMYRISVCSTVVVVGPYGDPRSKKIVLFRICHRFFTAKFFFVYYFFQIFHLDMCSN